MKNNLRKIKMLFVLLFAIFFSCEKDLYENGLQNNANNITQKHIKLKDLDIKTISKINQKITEAKKLIKKNSNDNTINKFEYNDDFGFYIDLENGRLIDNNGELSYTFPMFRESEEKLENIVFKPIENGEMEAYIARYRVDSEEFSELTLEEKEDLAPEFYRIYFGGIQYVCSDFSYSVTTYPNCPHPGGVHSNGLTCEPTTTTYVTTFCSWTEGGGGGSTTGGSTTGNTGDTGGNYTGSSGGSGTGGVSTTPVTLTPKDLLIKEFKKHLLETGNTTCFNDLTQDKKDAINNFLSISLEEDCDGNPFTNDQQFEFLEELLADLCAGGQNAQDAWDTFESQFLNTNIENEDDSSLDLESLNMTFLQQQLPTFDNFILAFPSHLDSNFETSQQVYTYVGGNVLIKYNQGARNTCALRVSRGLNYSGVTIPNIPGVTVKGSDNKNYFLVASNLNSWMKNTFGTPTGTNHLKTCDGGINGIGFKEKLQNKQGIYIMIPNNKDLFEATGHADMFFDGDCDGNCYFNPQGGVKDIYFYELQ